MLAALGAFAVIGAIGNIFRIAAGRSDHKPMPFLIMTAIGFVMIGVGLRGTTSGSAAAVPAGSSKADVLQNISLRGFRGTTDGFGAVLIASFTLNNENNFEIKDVTVTCELAGASGTVVGQNSITVYERIPARGFHVVHDLNMGFINTSTTKTACGVTGFVGVS